MAKIGLSFAIKLPTKIILDSQPLIVYLPIMKRYTHKNLTADVEILNAKLAEKGHEMRFMIGARNGYSAIDLATVEQLARHCCQRMLIGGTPRECLAACHEYMVHSM